MRARRENGKKPSAGGSLEWDGEKEAFRMVMAGPASVLGMYLAIRLPMGIQQGACCPFPKKQYNGGMKITSEVAYEVYPFV